MQMTQLRKLSTSIDSIIDFWFVCANQISGYHILLMKNLLNQHILKEVNGHRKKVKADALYVDKLLKPAADDHSAYMAEHDIITHFSKI
jgi:uncharacterized protein YkwD